MLDTILFSAVMMAPELGAAAGSAFSSWARGLAKEMAEAAVEEAVKQTKAALPAFMQGGATKLAKELVPSVTSMATEKAEQMITSALAGYAIVPVAVYEAQLAVVNALRQGQDTEPALAALDALTKPSA